MERREWLGCKLIFVSEMAFCVLFFVKLIERVFEMHELFIEVQGHFQSQHQYDKFIKEAQKEYDIKIYRLQHFSREYALDIFQELNQK